MLTPEEALKIARKAEKLAAKIVKSAADGKLDIGEIIDLSVTTAKLLKFAYKAARD